MPSQLPDLEFPINAMAEGRILVPWERRVPSNTTLQRNIGESSHLLRTARTDLSQTQFVTS